MKAERQSIFFGTVDKEENARIMGEGLGAMFPPAEMAKLRPRPEKIEVAVRRQADDTYRLEYGGTSVPLNRKQRRTLDAESRRKKRRARARR